MYDAQTFRLLHLVLPYVTLFGGLVFLIYSQVRHRPAASRILLYSFIFTTVVTAGFVIWSFTSIYSSTSSTAPIAFLFLPNYAYAVTSSGFIVAWSVLTLARLVPPAQTHLKAGKAGTFPVLIAVAALIVFTVWAIDYGSRAALVHTAASGDTETVRLSDIADRALKETDYELLEKIADNSNAEPALLKRIFDHCEKARSKPDRSAPCYSVYHSMGRNANATDSILAKLAHAPEQTIRNSVGFNPSTPIEVLVALSRDEDDRVRLFVTLNPNLPLSALVALSEDDVESVRSYATAAIQRRKRETDPAK